MTENKKYCMGCMKEIDADAIECPHCNYNAASVQHSPCLPKESIISGRYLVGKAVSISTDSITYIGLDKETEEIVSVHEFFPFRIVDRAEGVSEVSVKLGYDAMFRNCLQSFIKLWKGIGSIEGEISLPEVRNILDYNGTVYTVCKYLDSISLKSFFAETKKPLAWQKANSAFKNILSALSALHAKGVIHGSVSPSSVHVGSDGKLHLTGFSIPESYSAVRELASPNLGGFAPVELYKEDRTLTPASDVYSVMALIYYCITGLVPSKATERVVKDEMVIPSSVAATLPKHVIGVFIKGLSINHESRIQTIDELSRALAPVTQPKPAPAQKSVPAAKPSGSSSVPTEKKSNTKKSKKKKGDSSLVALAIGTFAGVVVLCTVIFSILYTTVLYKSYDVPVLNKIFSSFSFLPMNKEQENIPVFDETSTTEYVTQEKTYVTVPDFTAHTYDSIVSNETFTKNFKFNFTYEYNADFAKNAVISQDLTKGESVLAGTTVNILVSKGAEQIELPEVIGLEYEEATSRLKDAGFKVKVEMLENNGSHTAGTVEMTDKVAGLEFDKGTEIILSVWDEVEEEETEEDTTKKSEKSDSDE